MSINRIPVCVLCLFYVISPAICTERVEISREFNINSHIAIFRRLSLDECIDRCKERVTCDHISYKTRAHVCYLIPSVPNTPATLVAASGVLSSSKLNWDMTAYAGCVQCKSGERCIKENSTCVTTDCDIPPMFPHTTIQGDVYHIGYTVVYRCDVNVGIAYPSRCLPSAQWSNITVVCDASTITQTPTTTTTTTTTTTLPPPTTTSTSTTTTTTPPPKTTSTSTTTTTTTTLPPPTTTTTSTTSTTTTTPPPTTTSTTTTTTLPPPTTTSTSTTTTTTPPPTTTTTSTTSTTTTTPPPTTTSTTTTTTTTTTTLPPPTTTTPGDAWFVCGSSQYLFDINEVTWTNAKDLCSSRGGHLADLKDLSVLTCIESQYYVLHSGRRDFWIGANDLNNEDSFVWSDGSSVLSNWDTDEPNSLTGEEDCVSFYTRDFKWNDAMCTSVRCFLCEKP